MKKISYADSGVDYSKLDAMKRLAQQKAAATASQLDAAGMKELSQSRGESAYVWDAGDSYMALVVEGLGTKNLVADAMRQVTGKTYYDQIAQDTVAMIINDIIVVGARPMVVNAYFGVGDSAWMADEERATDLVTGWAQACEESGATWGGGETPGLSGIINPETIDLSGSCVGIINPKDRVVLGDKLESGDRIVLIESSGVHANGISLVRKIADGLPEGYATKLPSGAMLGDTILKPSHLYAKFVQSIFEAGADIHYMVNITGHGWRKLMRAPKDFTYTLDFVPEVPEEFDFIAEQAGNSVADMYGNYNMGAGFAVYVPKRDVKTVVKCAEVAGFKAWDAGEVKDGPKRVIINPVNVAFEGKDLEVRS